MTRVQVAGALGVVGACVAYGALVFWREAWLLSALRPPPISPFFAFTIAALILLAAGNRLREQGSEDDASFGSPPSLEGHQDSHLWKPWRIALLLLASTATGFSVYLLLHLPPEVNRASLLPVWASSICLYVVAFLRRGDLTWPRQRSPLHRWELPLLIGILALGLYLRVSDLGTIPYTLNGDEAAQGLEALKVIRGEIRDPFATGWRGVPTLNFYFTSLFVEAMGPTAASLRLPWALLGTMTILATYTLVRALIDPPTALLTAALLTTYHYHIHFSRLGSNQIADPLLASLALLFLFRALRTGRQLDWALVGIASGMALYFYVGARLVPLLVAVIFVAEVVSGGRPALRRHLPGLSIATVGFVISAGPILQHAVRFPDLFNVRIAERGILQSGWLVREMGARGETAWTILYDQFRHAALAFNYYPDRTTFYGLTHPFLDPFFGALFLVGLIAAAMLAVVPNLDGNLPTFVVWWLGATILGGMLVDSPPSSQQLVTLTVPACLFVAWALRGLSQLGQSAIPRLKVGIFLGCAAGLFAALSLRTYFHDYTPDRLSGGPYAELATAVAPELERLGASYAVYLLGAPWMYADFPTLTYLAPSVEIIDLPERVTETLLNDLVAGGQGLAFVVIPQRTEELAVLQEAFPGGGVQGLLRPSDRRVTATLYIVPPLDESVERPRLSSQPTR